METIKKQAAAKASATKRESQWNVAAEKVAASISRVVRRTTFGQVQNLKVEIRREGILLSGRCGSFHSKQLAQHAAMQVANGREVINQIEVV